MYRALPASRQVASTSSRGAVRVVRRRIATEANPVPKKKKGVVRRIFWATTTLTGTFYFGSTFAAFNNQTYYDFFSDHVPLGQSMLEYAETHGWDKITIKDVVDTGTNVVVTTQRFITDTINRTPGAHDAVESAKRTVETKTEEAKAATLKIIRGTKARVEPVVTQVKTEVQETAQKVETIGKEQAQQVSDELASLVLKAEAALAGKPFPSDSTATALPDVVPAVDATPPSIAKDAEKHVYSVPLPLGFEPPPGFSRPAPPKKAEPEPVAEAESPLVIEAPVIVTLPLVAPSVSSLGESEPIISHLAGTIDNLASYLASNPEAASKATDVLEIAKNDLTALGERIEKSKLDERLALEAKLDEQTREYTLKLMELEMEAQDKLDDQQEGFRKFFDDERVKLAQSYREKLEQELKTQTELINERLKEEVIAQGIELQRRWIREIKVRVEQERGGRLAKLDELSASLKKLERIALDNSTYLDENIRVHALWSAVRAVTSAALGSPVRKPFREELRTLRHIAAAREDPVVAIALDTLEETDVPDVGVEPFADLASWFASEVAPKVSQVALVPDENAGVLSYLASRALSGFRFKRQGLVAGDDILSVLARAEYHLNEKDLDSAARELNQLKGPARMLLHDWLEAARRRLEVQQALDVVQTQATLASLLVV
ncbi:mitochondrial inner membrane protein Mitofilin [Crucibulum laeve]|uniref:MICOS complex subunit MIC60 n=1 Tax=Crucibulum laeve TaxID=68775 RepID=A0A5C3M6D2_9AGAR|nr:mitochondrial inner membrane protein Mitofilin [Crucibulum laeve]